MLVNNETGIVQPLAEVAALVRERARGRGPAHRRGAGAAVARPRASAPRPPISSRSPGTSSVGRRASARSSCAARRRARAARRRRRSRAWSAGRYPERRRHRRVRRGARAHGAAARRGERAHRGVARPACSAGCSAAVAGLDRQRAIRTRRVAGILHVVLSRRRSRDAARRARPARASTRRRDRRAVRARSIRRTCSLAMGIDRATARCRRPLQPRLRRRPTADIDARARGRSRADGRRTAPARRRGVSVDARGGHGDDERRRRLVGRGRAAARRRATTSPASRSSSGVARATPAAAASPTSRTRAASRRSSASRTTCSTSPTSSTRRRRPVRRAPTQAGETPNPCVECNRSIKFGRAARSRDAARLRRARHRPPRARPLDARRIPRSRRGADPAKDQSYVLYMLGQRELSRTLLPVGELTKADVRARAARARAPHRGEAGEHGRLLHHAGRPRRVPRRAHRTTTRRDRRRRRRDRRRRTTASTRSRSGSGAASASRSASGATSSTSHAATGTVTIGTRDDLLRDRVDLDGATCGASGRAAGRIGRSCSGVRTVTRSAHGSRATVCRSNAPQPPRRARPGGGVLRRRPRARRRYRARSRVGAPGQVGMRRSPAATSNASAEHGRDEHHVGTDEHARRSGRGAGRTSPVRRSRIVTLRAVDAEAEVERVGEARSRLGAARAGRCAPAASVPGSSEDQRVDDDDAGGHQHDPPARQRVRANGRGTRRRRTRRRARSRRRTT